MEAATIDPAAELERLFAFPAFRPGQREAVEALLAGRDVLAVMPTGSGKSLCYQLPALVGEGATLVVSPLIALMQDQQAALRARGLDGVEMLASSMSAEAVAAALRRIRGGEARLVYVAPERFSSRRFLDALAEARVSRLAVDEAHCLSEWGHDFRPDYLRLADVRRWLGSPPTIALTATATPRVARDVAAALDLRDPLHVRTGFDRPNLVFAVRPAAGEQAKAGILRRLVSDRQALPALVYCGRRRTAEEVAELVASTGVSAAAYHAGLSADRRSGVLQAFLAGELEVVAATTAFGMGIDKADVRSVVHWTVPASPEEYYQQAGRAGRDGEPARCTLLYAPRDKSLIVFFINRAKLSPAQLAGVHARLAACADERLRFAIAQGDVPADDPAVALAVLERAGALELFPAPGGGFAGRLQAASLDPRHAGAAQAAVRRVEQQRWTRLRAIEAYATTEGCRREALLGYFGERPAPRPPELCCDNHGSGGSSPAADATAAIMSAVDDTHGAVGRSRLAQILRGSRGRGLLAAGQDRLPAYGELAHLDEREVLRRIDRLIDEGTLTRSGGPYPLVRRTPGR